MTSILIWRPSSATAPSYWSACSSRWSRRCTVRNLVMGRRSIAGSAIGGIAETQEMLDFCAAHGIACDIEMIEIQQINQAYERMLASDVKYRFVIDMASLQKSF